MAKAKRVFQVAKELGVTSKAIVAKCQAEGVPDITNHMSTVKVGLEVTVHEWFAEAASGEAGSHTAVETAEKVDLSKARKGVRRRKATQKTATLSSHDTATAEADVDTMVVTTPQAHLRSSAKAVSATDESGFDSASATAVVTAPAPASGVPATPDDQDSQTGKDDTTDSPSDNSTAITGAKPSPRQVGPIGKPNVPNRPQVIKPVGEQLAKPKEAVLKGPKVVRIERADQVEPRRPRQPAAAGPPAFPGTVEGITRSRGPERGRGAGGSPGSSSPQRSPTSTRQDDRRGKPGKRRSLTTRRGRSADAQLTTGPGTVSEQDLIELDARLRGAPGYLKQRRRDMKKRQEHTQSGPTPVEIGGTVEIAEPITIKSLSAVTGIKSSDVIKYLFNKGIMATINYAIETETAKEVALEYNIELQVRQLQTAEQQVLEEFEKRRQIDVRPRPPVVTVLGHVDHGKTSLLDKIRKTDVASHEAGGITQHVGAYRITIEGDTKEPKAVVFLDTPGHQAFTSMRARGAQMTDIVVLVVAGDDGVMPQTIESINHAKAAQVPIIVAINKVDRPEASDANIQKVYGQLAEQGLTPADWGGDTEIVKTSAETGQGITELLEYLDYRAELLELKADFAGAARGTVIEAEMQEGRGPVARVLVQEGQINVGDFVVIGRAFGRVRNMTDDRNQSIRQAGPATPLELSGIDKVPDAGDKFYITDTLKKAEEVANQYRNSERQQLLASKTKVTLDNFAATIKADARKELRVVLKADVQGSHDVLTKTLSQLGNDEVAVRVIHAAVGGINESDVLLAEASEAIIVGFHVIASSHARDLAEQRKTEIRLYHVIYDVTDDITKALEGMLAPETHEEIVGEAEVRQVFRISKLGNIAGCLVSEGLIRKAGVKMRLIRDDVVVTDNRVIENLRRSKDDAAEVRVGTECGIRLVDFDDIKPGDKLVCYTVNAVARKLT